ncbi:2-oxoglutarate and Fe(II)-dependent oxygenase superfamily protein [Quillaja saponaria]|uniref:2-oxoglutarate and Fe(II)-dependent oxygenase superfamily protein n=1 Tax=Quillaja saponaria TaxID=32244 RepID=A0AAD7KW31_QUISA|nr:2-oxoglutarate and Fe(II)-dependent oxygenase superfamily protein [Quillaja saponaria]
MGEVDPAFIQDQEHRPRSSIIEAENIPVIDLSPLNTQEAGDSTSDSSSSIHGLVKEIGSACKEWGFFQVINHGVSLDTRQRMEAASRKFFAQSLEEKRKVSRDDKGRLGYYDAEHTQNIRDWKEVFDSLVQDPTLVPLSHEEDDDQVTHWTNQWPQYPPDLREASQAYVQEMEKLAYKLMELIALSLGLPVKRFHGFFKIQTSFARLNRYPPCACPNLALGVGRHKDAGVLTILAEDDVAGLEVKRKSDGEWVLVKPTPNAFVINVGDIIQVWSNNMFESVEHRAILNSEKERLSVPFFFNPAHYAIIEPLEELINEQNPPKYRPYNWGKFLTNRKHTSFKKLNVENLQVYDFKVPQE